MKRNMGGVDRAVRIVFGLAIIGAGVAFRSWWGAVGAVPLLTGIVGFCPAYLPISFSTARD